MSYRTMLDIVLRSGLLDIVCPCSLTMDRRTKPALPYVAVTKKRLQHLTRLLYCLVYLRFIMRLSTSHLPRISVLTPASSLQRAQSFLRFPGDAIRSVPASTKGVL